jgi:anthranilate synthase component 1
VRVERLMEVERYSHVMHISSTVTGRLRPELSAWDALRAALPAGTVSGAPKVPARLIWPLRLRPDTPLRLCMRAGTLNCARENDNKGAQNLAPLPTT